MWTGLQEDGGVPHPHLTPLCQVSHTPKRWLPESARLPDPMRMGKGHQGRIWNEPCISKEVQLQGDLQRQEDLGSGLWVMLRYLLQLESGNYSGIRPAWWQLSPSLLQLLTLIRPVLSAVRGLGRGHLESPSIFLDTERRQEKKKIIVFLKSAKWILRKILFWRK